MRRGGSFKNPAVQHHFNGIARTNLNLFYFSSLREQQQILWIWKKQTLLPPSKKASIKEQNAINLCHMDIRPVTETESWLWMISLRIFLLLCHLLSTLLSPPLLTFLLPPPLPLSPTKMLLIEHPALSFKLQGAYTVHLTGGRSSRYQEAFENVLHIAHGYKDAGCPKNNNKEAFDRFMAFCISTDAVHLKLAPQIICRLNNLRTIWCDIWKTPLTYFLSEKKKSHSF